MGMKKLNLPIIKAGVLASKSLSMDDYVNFVNLNLQYIVNKKTIREQKKIAMVNVPFSLKK